MRVLICLILILFTFNGYSQDFQIKEHSLKKLVVGEDFTYVVKYAFLRLGEVRIRVVEKTKIRNVPVYKTEAYIDSYPDLPFVSIHQVYESYIDSTFFPLKFYARIFGDDTVFVQYSFLNHSKIEMQKGKLGSSHLYLDSTAVINKRFQDGLSILFYTMMNMGTQKSLNVPCFVNEKKENAKLNYYSGTEPISVESVDYEIECLHLDGETNFVSVYGLTGKFEGWFSNDELSVPIVANMQVLIGNVRLELIKWNKELWNPPNYND
jgi:hypothetical protein